MASGEIFELNSFESDGVTPLLIEAYRTDNPNLCIHKAVLKNECVFNVAVEAWDVSHVLTGGNVVSMLPSRAVAEMVASWLSLQGVDWTLHGRKQVQDTSLKFREDLRFLRSAVETYTDSICEILGAIGSNLVASVEEDDEESLVISVERVPIQ